MKCLFSLITLFFFTLSYGQDYPQMVEEGATWIYEQKENGSTTYFAYHIKGDTTLNGVQYSILNLQDLMYNLDGIWSITSLSIPLAYLREDVDTKKVFAIIDDATTFSLSFGLSLEAFEESHLLGENADEYLLYDFSQEVGDYLGTEIDVEISNIESVEYFDYDVRKFELAGGNPFHEKLGTNEGLFFPHHIFFIGGAFVNLIQYCVTDSFECEVMVGPSDVDNLAASDFIVFPNPADDVVTIKVPNEKIQSLQFFSAEGKLIYIQKGIDSNEFSVDLSNVNYNGLIYIEGITTNSKFVDRIIKF